MQTYSAVDGAVESIKEFAANATARRVVFNKQNLWWTNPPGICELTLLPNLYRLFTRLRCLRWHCVRNVVDVLAVHRVDSVVLTNRIDQIIEVFKTHGTC